jgi:hypothetical protein
MLKFFAKDKVEIISLWPDEIISWASGQMNYPATIKLKEPFKRTFHRYANFTFSRKEIVKRDESCCQYCGEKLSPSKITIDHVIPKSHGGTTSFTNCVVACYPCNGKKANKTPEQANVVLLKRPAFPSFSANYYDSDEDGPWHPDWDTFVPANKKT